jgi:DNA-binding XRE family transcriptional regulator/uncharacterized phage-associated protein
MLTHLKKFREKQGYTQDYLAKKIKVSRPTFIQIEKGKRKLNIDEAQILAKIFNLSLDDFFAGKEISEPKITISKTKKDKEPEIRINIPQRNLKKFKEILLYTLSKIGGKPNVGETVIYKLLYFIDFDYYEKYEEQIIGATYIKNHHGPTPIEFIKVVEDMKKNNELRIYKSNYFGHIQKRYQALREANLANITAQEIKHVDEVLARLGDKNAKELSDYSHEDTPWQTHEMGEKIDYETVFYRNNKHSVKSYDDEL